MITLKYIIGRIKFIGAAKIMELNINLRTLSGARKFIILWSIVALIPMFLAGCSPNSAAENIIADENDANKAFIISVFGAIHGGHRTSRSYSLDVMEKAVRDFNPDVIFIEIPKSSLAQAQSSFDQFGEVRERRTRAFPELTDVVFPLKNELGFDLVATAGWSRQLADNRAAVLKRIENDPTRSAQWNEHIAARRRLGRIQRGKNDDPFYIHTQQYDDEVKTAQTPYETYFDADIGDGGWGPINQAHIGLMTQGLDDLSTQGASKNNPKRVLIIFGAWHKYKILEAMEKRDDVALVDARQFFAEK